MRKAVVGMMVASFVALAVIDISRGELRTGVAGLLLAIVQAIIFF